MKFDHLLRIYWSRYFLYGGVTYPFSMSLKNLRRTLRGIGSYFVGLLEKRFELGSLRKWERLPFTSPLLSHLKHSLNVHLAQLLNINGDVREWEHANLMRFYMIKSYHGRALALGKPARGQRTWSNAHTSKLSKSSFKTFVSFMQGERLKKAALLAKKSFLQRVRLRPQKRRIRRRSKRQKRMQLHIDAESLWF